MGRRTTLLAALALLAPAAAAGAGWETRRGDPARTAYVEGHSNLDTLAAKWTYYLGGSISRWQYWAGDLDRDGGSELLVLSAGKLAAKTPDDITLWQTANLNLVGIGAVADLDGDGAPEIVAGPARQTVYLFDGATGAILWRLEEGVIGTPSRVQLHDFDGDSFLDLYVADCYCCGLTTGRTVAISFSGGFGAPRALFELDRPPSCDPVDDMFIDADGDGTREVVSVERTEIIAYSTTDGSIKYRSDDLGYLRYGNIVRAEDVDGNGRPEIFVFTNQYAAGTGQKARRVLAVEFDPAEGTFMPEWEFGTPDPDTGDIAFHDRSVSDLDGDGDREVALSLFTPADGWTLHVRDAATGAALASAPDERLVGLADLRGDEGTVLLATSGTANLDALVYADGALTRLWRITGETTLDVVDRARRNESSAFMRTLALDLDADGRDELVTTLANAVGRVPTLTAWDADTASPVERARADLPSGVDLVAWEVFDQVTRPGAQILAAQSDGFMVALDDALAPTNVSDDPEFPLRGVRIGGYCGADRELHATPVVVVQSSPPETAVLVADSRGATVKLDPLAASMTAPPVPAWTFENERHPVAADLDGDGDREVVTVSASQVIVRDLDGASRLVKTVTTTRSQAILLDALPGDADGDGAPEIFYSVFDQNGWVRRFNALDPASGLPVWPSDYAYGNATRYPFAVADLTGDGKDDLLVVLHTLKALSGADGAVADEYGFETQQDLPMAADWDGDTLVEVVLQGGSNPVRLLENDLTRVWSSTDGTAEYYGAVLPCAGGRKLVTSNHSSCLLERFDMATGAREEARCLAGGALYDDEAAARAAGRLPGFLSPVSGHEDLTGTGAKTAAVGSTDGWLFLVDGCAFAVLAARDMGAPVGEPVLGDIDGDGMSEVLVMTGDGALTALDKEATPGPAWVYENDGTGPAGSAAEDVDALETFDTLWANWAAVAEATSFSYLVMTSGGSVLTSPAWVDAGAATAATAQGLPLKLDGIYYVAVKAHGAAGASFAVLSDGVKVTDVSPPEAVVAADPAAFTAGAASPPSSTRVTAHLADRTSLARYSWVVRDARGDVVLTTADAAAEGTALDAAFTWDGTDEEGELVAAGRYEVRVSVTDVGGHTVEEGVEVEVRREADAEADAGEPDAADGGAETGAGGGGCDCAWVK